MEHRVHPTTKRALVFIVLLVFIVAITQSFLVKPAMADFSWCTGSGKICLAEHTYGNGARYIIYSPVGVCTNLPSSWNDRVSSLRNAFLSSGGTFTLYYDANCRGWSDVFSPNHTYNGIPWPGNDEGTSWWLGPGAP